MSTIFNESEFDWSGGESYRDTVFLNSVFRGPAILDVRGGHIERVMLDYSPSHRSTPRGAVTYSDAPPPDALPHVELRDCEFYDCKFTDVWFWAPSAWFPKTRLAQWWFMRRHFTFENVTRKIYRGPEQSISEDT